MSTCANQRNKRGKKGRAASLEILLKFSGQIQVIPPGSYACGVLVATSVTKKFWVAGEAASLHPLENLTEMILSGTPQVRPITWAMIKWTVGHMAMSLDANAGSL